MYTNILATAATLSDGDLVARLRVLAGKEREASVELVAHLAVLETRPALYAADGYGSLFSYCTRALALSEDAACNRIEAARACRRFPYVLELLAAGTLSLTSVRLLRRHLTEENHRAVLARAENKSRREIEALVAELAPRPDAPSLVRRLPQPRLETRVPAAPSENVIVAPAPSVTPIALPAPISRPASRPVVEALAPQRYRVQFTIGQETQDKLRRLQALLRCEIPDGDPGAIFGRAVGLLLEKVERQKIGKAERPRPAPVIRPGTDNDDPEGPLPPRDPPRAVRRAVWTRDEGRCAYVSSQGRRCEERTFLEFHHLRPYAKRGQPTVDNIALRCRRHNQYEAELVFADPERRAPNALTWRPLGFRRTLVQSFGRRFPGNHSQVSGVPCIPTTYWRKAMVRRLGAAIVLVLAAIASPAWADGDAVQEVTEITIEPKTHVTFGIGYGGPLGGAASFELLKGLGADVREDSDRVKAIAGALLQLHAGTGGGKLSLGLGAHAHIRTEDFKGTAAAALKLSLARTWHSPIDSGTEQTYLGPELELSVKHVAVDLGVLFRLSGSGGHTAIFSWGLGVRVP